MCNFVVLLLLLICIVEACIQIKNNKNINKITGEQQQQQKDQSTSDYTERLPHCMLSCWSDVPPIEASSDKEQYYIRSVRHLQM